MLGTNLKTSNRNELLSRFASAAVLIPFALFVVIKGGWVLAIACAAFAAIMAYEWVRMSASPLLVQIVCLAMIPSLLAPVLPIGQTFGLLLICCCVAGAIHPVSGQRLTSAYGCLYVSVQPLAMYWLREGNWDGEVLALLILGLVWASDATAFFVGRCVGGALLTKESPSKTWSGALGAVFVSTLFGMLAGHLISQNIFIWLIIGALVSVVAQFGDLVESIIKRRHGVKNASSLVPGHGGVMDRVDGLGMVSVVVLAGLLFLQVVSAYLGLEF